MRPSELANHIRKVMTTMEEHGVKLMPPGHVLCKRCEGTGRWDEPPHNDPRRICPICGGYGYHRDLGPAPF